MAKKTGLGRGLDVLLPDNDELIQNVVQEVAIDDIDPNLQQPRRSFDEEPMAQLAQSIAQSGVLQPILVAEYNGRYRIIAGERRWRAARMAGLSTIPCIVKDFDRMQQMEAALVENLQREDLNPMDEAEAVSALMEECGYTQEAAAERLGRSRPAVANLLRLLTLPEEVRELVRTGALSQGHARALVGITPESRLLDLAHECILKGWSVRQLEQLAAMKEPAAPKIRQAKVLPPELAELEERIRQATGVRTTFTGTRKKGKIILNYYSADELERLYEALERITD